MRKVLLVAALLAGMVLSGCDNNPATREVTELSYDDGSAESNISPWSESAGGQVAVGFKADYAPVKVIGVKVYVTSAGVPGTSFKLKLFAKSDTEDGPGDAIAMPDKIASAATGDEWIEFDLTGDDIEIDGDTFFAGIEWLTAPGLDGLDAQWVGADTSRPDSRSYIIWPGAVEWTLRDSSDLLIRASVQ